jgi:hypothetical protein
MAQENQDQVTDVDGAGIAQTVAEDAKVDVVANAIASLTRYVAGIVADTAGDARLYSEYGELLNIGIVDGRIVLAAEDGTSFTIRVSHDTYASLTNWKRVAEVRASALGHEVGDWEWAGSYGYIASCRHCMGLMVVSTEKPPVGEVFYRTCPKVGKQLPFDYSEIGPHDQL